MSAGRFVGVTTALVVTLAAACGVDGPGTSPASPTWGATALRWLDAAEEAGAEGVGNLERFLTPRVVWDLRATGGDLTRRTGPVLTRLRSLDSTHRGFTRLPPTYLGADGFVLPVTWSTGRHLEIVDAVLVVRMSPAGVVRVTSAVSLVSGGSLVEPPPERLTLDSLADGYVRGLSGDGVATELDDVPNGGGPAVYGVPRTASDGGFVQAVLLLRTDDGTGCPGRSARVLTLGPEGAILGEERYLAVADARRCLGAADLPSGWWVGATPPAAVEHIRTGTLRIGDAVVEIWNGTPALAGLVRWAFGRFRAAGLPPRPTAVTFYPNADRCVGHIAVAGGTATDQIALCFGEPLACHRQPCPPWSALARTTVLHELAHTWLTQNLSEELRERFEERVGLGWWDEGAPWEERAVEHAAETIAWGVQRDPVVPRIDIAPDELAARFRLLTGEEPVPLR